MMKNPTNADTLLRRAGRYARDGFRRSGCTTPDPARCSSMSASRHQQGGFTIVELMVATVVFSTVLVVITAGVMRFTSTYYGSLNRSKVQNTARNIVGGISQGIQFTGTTVATTVDTGADYFCTGGKLYTFKTGVKYTGGTATAANPGLYVVPQPSGCAALDSSGYNNPLGQQLLGPNMRIANLTISSVGSQLYRISLTLAYGDDDLLSATSGTGISCLSRAGSQYCAVSALNTTVHRRLQDNQLGQ